MQFTDMQFSFEAMRWLVMGALGIYSWFIGRQAASAAELLELRTRITTLEVQMKQVPSQQQLHDIATNVARLAGAVDAVNERITPMTRSVERVENFLLHKSN
ncbi:DUF2730 family protein [Comamonas sp.]|uniref:DUF2730 family protein n=1 Tax=Comamonas sp. TaxID=34028 RepID=UPI00289F345D|nr:DUF2730 family protein [Comamonas sp.]